MFKEDIKKYSKTFAKVFTGEVIDALERLEEKGVIAEIGGVIKEGKEGAVCLGKDKTGNRVAIKIYKINTSRFHQMREGLLGDRRIKGAGMVRRKIVFQWAEREFKNMALVSEFLENVPKGLGVYKNVLVMTWIGDEDPAPTLQMTKIDDVESVIKQIRDILNKMKEHNFVHGDFSQYNLLYYRGTVYPIDFSHGTYCDTEMARERRKRDIETLNKFFKRQYKY